MTSTELDVLIVGGGIVGAGCALDAASRGLSVGLIEARDLAAGTSSRSSKLIHGGLRYLEMLDFRLVTEALGERSLLLTSLAPHLVRQVPFLYPLRHRGWERLYAGTGVALYDTLSSLAGRRRGVPRHRHLTRTGARRLVPDLRPDALIGAIQYYDAQVDDARYTLFVARTAASLGAHIATRTRMADWLRDGERVSGAVVVDQESGQRHTIHAQAVINATGVWTNEAQRLLGTAEAVQVRASKGVHLLVPRETIRSETGLILRTEKSVLFVIPWGAHWLIGTTDTDWALDKQHPAATSADIDYLLEHVNAVLEHPIHRADIVGVYAGLRPLLAAAGFTAKLSREHAVANPTPGLVVVAGGKYTTYRVMAADAVDSAASLLRRPVPPSFTDQVPLLGAARYAEMCRTAPDIASASAIPEVAIRRLLDRYGALADEVLEMVRADPSLGKPLLGAAPYLRAEVVYAASHEGARHLDDVLTRRTRISIETRDRGIAAAGDVAVLMGQALGWAPAEVTREVDHYRMRVEAEIASQQKANDAEADATRRLAPDIVPMP